MQILKMVARILVGAYLGAILMLVLFENWIIFPAPPLAMGDWDAKKFGATEEFIETSDGGKVHAWVFAHPKAKATIVYTHGNGEFLGVMGDYMRGIRNEWQVNVVAYDYRGYGKTGGKPGKNEMEFDAIAVGNWVTSHATWNEVPMIAMGRSMGGFPAVVLATDQKLSGLILDRTFSSIVDVGAYRYPVFPVRWLMRNRIRTVDLIKDYEGELLQIHGKNDRVIPYQFGVALFEACPSAQKEFISKEYLHHNDLLPPEFWNAGRDLIDRVHAASQKELK